MRYEKPEVTPLASAVSAIQGCTSKNIGDPDSCDVHEKPTTNAYEADE
jgi:hypothetical protein